MPADPDPERPYRHREPDTGLVISLASSTDSLEMDGIFVDAGINEASVFSQLGYKDMSGLATYELPTLYPRMKEKPPIPSGRSRSRRMASRFP